MKSEKLTLTKRISFDGFIKMSMLSALLTLWYSGLQAQTTCPLACNNLVQVSMDDDCIVEIIPDMMLEGQGVAPGCNYVVQVLGTNGQPLPTSPNITSANIGQTLTVRVWLGNNSCWGSISVEDKLPPVINCPEEVTVGCWENPSFTLPTATDNCGGNPVVRVLSDIETDLGCDREFRARRVIRYQAVDASNNLSPVCERVIMYEAANFPSTIGFPKNYDGAPGQRPALDCDGSWAWNPNKSNINVPFPSNNWDVNNNGYPDPAETGAPFVRDNSNISGYINGFIVTTNTPAGCVQNTLVTPTQQSQFAMLGCGLAPFRVDTFYNPIIGGNNRCKINTTFTDTKIDICPKSFKVLRAWSVLDWCSGEILSRHQVIKVVDEKAPVVTCPADITGSPLADMFDDPEGQGVAGVITTDPYTCSGSWTVRPPVTINDCNETTWTVRFKKETVPGQVPGPEVPFVSQDGDTRVTGTYPNFRIINLPAGRTWIQYLVTDACGNIGECFTEIDVIDRTPPVAICDEFTVVTLSTNGRALVFAETFDDGSYDNCTAVTFDVRRMTAGCGQSTTAWAPFIEVCCDDVARDVIVELRVTDAFGNRNTCMVTVRTQDKVPPVITCPVNVTIDCGADTSAVALGLPVFSNTPLSTPYFTDNCSNPKLTWRNSGTISDCGQGVITRTFTVTDNGGRTASCTQTITVRNTTPYTGPTWPNSSVTVTGCMNADTEPTKTGLPVLGAGACSQVAYTYEDQVFPFVDNVCFKILRRWTVIDWCKFAPNTNTNGTSYPSVPVEGVNMWTFVQTIKVDDKDAPVIATNSKADTDAFGENCNGFVELTNSATDCTPSNQLKWTFTIDPNNDGVGPFITGNTNSASGTYPVGTHRITWKVEDQCGNETTISYTFRVLDKKKPTPYCISELTTVVMPSSSMVEIWAVDFDHGSTDNCPVTGCGLRFTFNGFRPPSSNNEVLFDKDGIVRGSWPTTNASLLARYSSGELQRWLPSSCSSAKVYTCDHVGSNTEDMSVWDASGNTDFCTVTLNVQANDACGGSRIAGVIGTIENESVDNVTVLLENMISNETRVVITDKDGQFDFYNVSNNVDYMIKPEKNDDPLNGVSTLDLVMIQRHILGVQPLSNPYKFIAADVNKDKRVTASDLVELRKLILGIYSQFPDNNSWRFFDKSIQVNDPNAVWNLDELIYVDDVVAGGLTNHFVAVKIGDVNGSAIANATSISTETRSAKPLTLNLTDREFFAGELVKLDITAENFANIAGAQWTFNFDETSLNFSNVKSNALQITTENINSNLSKEGKIAFSWNDVNGLNIESDKVLFTIEFEAIANNTISKSLTLTSDITKAEAYTNDLSAIQLGLSFRNISSNEFSLEQNNPNPFSATTSIAFTLPETGSINLTIYDVTGKVIRTLTGEYPKGKNEIMLSAEDFNAQGVMFYELEASGMKAIKKMIFLNK